MKAGGNSRTTPEWKRSNPLSSQEISVTLQGEKKVLRQQCNDYYMYGMFYSVTMRRSIILRSSGAEGDLDSVSEEEQSTTHHCVCCVLLMVERLNGMVDSG